EIAGVPAERGVSVLIVALKIGRARIHHDHVGAAETIDVETDTRHRYRDAEGAGDEVDVHISRIEAKPVSHSEPAHPDVVGVLTREIDDTALADFPAAQRRAERRGSG